MIISIFNFNIVRIVKFVTLYEETFLQTALLNFILEEITTVWLVVETLYLVVCLSVHFEENIQLSATFYFGIIHSVPT